MVSPSASVPSLKKGHHCTYDIHYHFVFGIKYRRALLSSEVVAEWVRLGLEISECYDIEIECFGSDKDHVHLLCSAHPKMAPGQIVRIYKSITARELFKTFPQIKKELWGQPLVPSGQGGRVLVRRLLCGDCRDKWHLGDFGTVCEEPGTTTRCGEPAAVVSAQP